MIIELGHYALILALVVAAVQSVFPVWGAVKSDHRLMGMAPGLAVIMFLLTCVSFGALTWAYLTSDFSLLNTYQNSHSDKPLIYKISGVWGNHEGSILLWVLILVLFGALVAVFSSNIPQRLRAATLGAQAGYPSHFCCLLLSPLTRSSASARPRCRLWPEPNAAGRGSGDPPTNPVRGLRGILHRLCVRSSCPYPRQA